MTNGGIDELRGVGSRGLVVVAGGAAGDWLLEKISEDSPTPSLFPPEGLKRLKDWRGKLWGGSGGLIVNDEKS